MYLLHNPESDPIRFGTLATAMQQGICNGSPFPRTYLVPTWYQIPVGVRKSKDRFCANINTQMVIIFPERVVHTLHYFSESYLYWQIADGACTRTRAHRSPSAAPWAVCVCRVSQS